MYIVLVPKKSNGFTMLPERHYFVDCLKKIPDKDILMKGIRILQVEREVEISMERKFTTKEVVL